MAKYKLDDVCEFITDGTHQTPEYCDEGGVIFLSSKDVTERKINWDDVKHISNSLHEKLYKRLSPKKDDILLAKNGTTGVAAIVDRNEIFDVYVSLAVLRPLTTINPKYLLYAINSPVAKRQFDAGLKGVGVPNLHLNVIRETVINVADREKQEKICVVLDKIAGVVDKRKEELNKLDNLIKARFVEMFGDRYVNDKNWNTTKLGDSISFNNGKAHEQVVDENGAYILVTSRAIASDFKDVRRTNELLFPLHKNDIVMVMSDVPNGKALAKCQLIEEDNKYTLNQRICSFDNYNYNPVFLLFLLSRHPYFLSFNDGNGQTNLRKNDILNCELIVPPMELQKEFASFVEQVNKSKVAVQKALDETQTLFDSLMQEYFG